jgi:hypothetical protein
MRHFFYYPLLLLFLSCRSNGIEGGKQLFMQNQEKFSEAVIVVTDVIKEMGHSNCGHYKDIFIIDHSNVVNSNCFPKRKDNLIKLLDMNLFYAISVYDSTSTSILFSISHETDRFLFLGTETDKHLLYSKEQVLPVAYNSCQVQVKVANNWWYLERTDSIY